MEARTHGYEIRLAAVQVTNGSTIASAAGTAEDRGQIAPVVAALAGALRVGLVGSAQVGFAAHIEPADTIRFDALESFTSGLTFFQYGEIDIALDHLQTATRLDADFAIAFVYEAIAYGARRQDDRAFEAASRAYALRSRVNERQRVHAEAVYYYFCGDFSRALDAQRLMAATYPGEPQLHRHVAQTYASMDLVDEAIRHSSAAVELDPLSASNHMILVSALAQAGRFPEARDALRQGRNRVPDAPVLLSSDATICMIEGNTEGALAVLQTLERRRGYSAHARSLRIRCFLVAGRLDEARTYLETDLLLNRTQADVAHEDLSRWWVAQLLTLKGKRQEAAGHAQLLAERPAQPYSLFALRSAAQAAAEAGSAPALATANEKLASVQAQYPSSRAAGFWLQAQGLLAASAGQMAEARKHMTQAHELWPDIANAFHLAQLFAAIGLFFEALPLYQSVVVRKGAAIRWEQQIAWVLSHAGAAHCCRALHLGAQAKEYNEAFLRLWGNQTGLAIVKEAFQATNGSR